jgi:hypothetical protein
VALDGPLSYRSFSHSVAKVVAFGRTTVQAQFNGRTGVVTALANAPGTFLVFGRVREPGQGGIGGVRVQDPRSGKSTLSSSSTDIGNFSLVGLTNTRLTFDKDTYESREFEAQPNMVADVAMQKIIRLAAGGSVKPDNLAPHDMSYIIGADECEPCRLIRVSVPAGGTMRLTLTWSESRAKMNLWVDGRMFPGTYPELTADVPVRAGELVVYVGMSPPIELYVPFTLAASQ